MLENSSVCVFFPQKSLPLVPFLSTRKQAAWCGHLCDKKRTCAVCRILPNVANFRLILIIPSNSSILMIRFRKWRSTEKVTNKQSNYAWCSVWILSCLLSLLGMESPTVLAASQHYNYPAGAGQCLRLLNGGDSSSTYAHEWIRLLHS